MGRHPSNSAVTEFLTTGCVESVGLKGVNMVCSLPEGPDAQLPRWGSLPTAEESPGCHSPCRIPSESEPPSPCDMVGPCLQTRPAQKKGKQQPLPGPLRKHPVGQVPPRHEALPSAKALPMQLMAVLSSKVGSEATEPAAGLAALRARGRAALTAVGQDPPAQPCQDAAQCSPFTVLPREHQQPPAQQQSRSAQRAQHPAQPPQGPAEVHMTEETRYLAQLRQELEDVEEQSAQQWKQQQLLAQMAQQWQERLQQQALRDHALVRQQWHEQWLLSGQQHPLQFHGSRSLQVDPVADVLTSLPCPSGASEEEDLLAGLPASLPPVALEHNNFNYEMLLTRQGPPPGLETVEGQVHLTFVRQEAKENKDPLLGKEGVWSSQEGHPQKVDLLSISSLLSRRPAISQEAVDVPWKL
ncbi:unnamed protein product [Polarella glacialis]|uniref:Uncharacterized protein n=1 Tax=Polarella glacialis TaxID=89957 RepID=A0A813LRN6_POLGL|nr:unnamed protein product [Polarella glacialis]